MANVAAVLTPLQLTAGASLAQNQGLRIPPDFVEAVGSYNSLSLISPLLTTIEVAGTPVGNATMLTANTLADLETMGSNSCPALSDSVPSGYATLTVSYDPPGFTGLILNTANIYLGNGDYGKFAQALSTADAYAQTTNIFINSAVNANTFMANTFDSVDSMTSGGITNVNLDTTNFAQDLTNLGELIDLADLDNLGSPLALIRRIIKLIGNVPIISISLINGGVPEDVVVNINNPTASVSDSAQKLIYQSMQSVTGDSLKQILTLLKVTTVGISTMADLLNPYKLFPNSFETLTVSTTSGLTKIYLDNQGTVNTTLVDLLPPFVIDPLA